MNESHHLKLRKKAAYISLGVGVSMLIVKMGAYILTGSVAIFSDAAESVVHIAATSMALFSIILSAKPADDSHPYGHGNIEYFSAGIEGFLIVLAAGVIIYEAIKDLIAVPQLYSLSTGALFIGGAGIVNFVLGYFLVKTGKRTNSLTLVADGKHVLTDAITSIGVIAGIILVLITDWSYFDPIIAIVIALNIVFTGYKLVRESIGGLMLETDPEIIKKLSDKLILTKKDYWIDLHELRYWKSGNKTFIDFHLILPYYFTIEQSHKEEKRIDEELEKEFPLSQIKIHFDFCNYDLCKYCNYQKCEVRKEINKINFEWNVEKLTGNAVYKIFT